MGKEEKMVDHRAHTHSHRLEKKKKEGVKVKL